MNNNISKAWSEWQFSTTYENLHVGKLSFDLIFVGCVFYTSCLKLQIFLKQYNIPVAIFVQRFYVRCFHLSCLCLRPLQNEDACQQIKLQVVEEVLCHFILSIFLLFKCLFIIKSNA